MTPTHTRWVTPRGDKLTGERIIRADAEAVTIYLPGGQEVTIPRDETRNVSAHRYYTFNGETIAVRDERGLGGVTSLVNDHHGTPIVSIPNTTWTQASVAKHYSDPFGAARGARRVATDQDRDANGSPGDRGFLGKSNDTTGLTQVGARYYDSMTGAFVSPDPVLDPSEPRHLNAYVYSYQNPTTHSDPTGLKADLIGGGGRGGGYSGCSSACTRPWREVLFGKSKPVVPPRAPSSVDRARDAAMAARGRDAAARAEAERAAINAAKDQAAVSRANVHYTKKKRNRDDDDIVTVYHYTDKRGFNGIRSSNPYRVKTGESKNGAGPFFTTRSPADNTAPNAYKKLGITREKSQYVVEFEIERSRLERLKGDRGDFVFIIRGGVQIPRGDVHYIGPTASWGE